MKPGRLRIDMGTAGAQHMRVCHHCQYRRPGAECICPEPCNWEMCPVEGERDDPFSYDKPPVPRFR